MEHVKKESVIFIGLACLIIGFLGGIVFSIYKSPATTPAPAPAPTQQAQQQGASQQTATKILALEREIAANPNNESALVELGHAYFDTDQPPKAIAAYTKALAINPDNASVWTDLGVMYRRNKQPDKAIEAFDKAISIEPAQEQARFNKGVVLMYDLKDTEAALKLWEELVAINPMAKAPNNVPVADIIVQVKDNLASQQK